MPTSQSYLDTLIANSTAAANAKKQALDTALERATTATFDEGGKPSYKKDDKGQTLYGTIDVDYLNRVRGLGAGAESSNMLRSGQYQRALAEGQAAYRAAVLGATEQTTTQKTNISNDLATEQAKYKAEYGTMPGTSSSSSSGSTSSSGKSGGPTTTPTVPAITQPPTVPTPAGSTPKYTTPRQMEEAQKKVTAKPVTVKPTPRPAPNTTVQKKPGTVTIRPGGRY